MRSDTEMARVADVSLNFTYLPTYLPQMRATALTKNVQFWMTLTMTIMTMKQREIWLLTNRGVQHVVQMHRACDALVEQDDSQSGSMVMT